MLLCCCESLPVAFTSVLGDLCFVPDVRMFALRTRRRKQHQNLGSSNKRDKVCYHVWEITYFLEENPRCHRVWTIRLPIMVRMTVVSLHFLLGEPVPQVQVSNMIFYYTLPLTSHVFHEIFF